MEIGESCKTGSLNVGSKPKAFRIDLNQTPVSSHREGDDDCLSRATEASVSVCSVCRTQVPARRGAALEELHPGWKCLRCLLKNEGSSSSGGGCIVERFDINASPPREAAAAAVVAMASRNDGTNEPPSPTTPSPHQEKRLTRRDQKIFSTGISVCRASLELSHSAQGFHHT